MRRGFFVSLLCLSLLGGCQSPETPPPEPSPAPEPAAAPEPPPEATVALTVTSRLLNVRESASAQSAAIGRLKKGEKVVLVEERGGWARVKLADSRIGWVDKRYVRKGEECLADRQPAVLSDPRFRMSAEGPHGRVVVEGEVDVDGKVAKTRVVSNPSGNGDLAKRAEAELKQMTFLPPVRNCRLRPFTYTYARSF